MPVSKTSLLKNISKRGASIKSSDIIEKSPQDSLKECRKYIQDFSSEYRNLDPLGKRDAIQSKIHSYVMSRTPLVTGFLTDDKQLKAMELVDFLTKEITDYGILTEALLDEDVNEIRGNEREIWVEKKGKVVVLRDKNGKQVRFETPEQQDIIMRKILGDVRLTQKYALVNARTLEGYRVAAIHSSATSPDPQKPMEDRFHSFVLRKFKSSKMDLSAIITNQGRGGVGAISDSMGKLFSILPTGGLAWVTVGPTASGKTTLNNAILMETPIDTRTVLAQNPSEIDARIRDSEGNVINDVVHLEASDFENPQPFDASMANIMDHMLRLSPTFVCFGELRTNYEFKLGMKIGLAGHPINCTFHAESSAGAISRFQTAYLSESQNEPPHLALKSITETIKFIVVQKIMRDGSRKVLQVSELLGVDEEDENKPLIRDLFIFYPDETAEYDETGKVTKINGVHKRVGKMSEKLAYKLALEGVPRNRYKFLMEDPSENETETYTGKIKYDYKTHSYEK